MKETGDQSKNAEYKSWKGPDANSQQGSGSENYLAHKDEITRKDLNTIKKQIKKPV